MGKLAESLSIKRNGEAFLCQIVKLYLPCSNDVLCTRVRLPPPPRFQRQLKTLAQGGKNRATHSGVTGLAKGKRDAL